MFITLNGPLKEKKSNTMYKTINLAATQQQFIKMSSLQPVSRWRTGLNPICIWCMIFFQNQVNISV